MTYIKRITMSGFKSFGDRTVSVKLAKGFTCIVGPNGNGKSNVIDALCFALGRLSKKTMRAKSLTDLIFAGTKSKKPSSKAEVTITFDNAGHEFPDASPEYDITRWVKAKGTSGYRLQGKAATREQVLNALAQANIDPDGSNQFVLQGRIVELTHMNTVQRREFIESLIGLEKYDEMKAETLKELEKADTDLGQFEVIFKEVSTQLKKVEKEKNDALRWKELDNDIKKYNAQLIALKIHTLRKEEQQIQADMEETQQIIQEMEGKVARQKEKIEAENVLLKSIEEDLTAREGEKAKLDEILTQAKTNLSAKETELKNAKENLVKLEERKKKLEEMQEKLKEGETYDMRIGITQNKIKQIVMKIDETSATIENTIKEQKIREGKIDGLNTEKVKINEEISKVRQEISKFQTEINLMDKNIKKNTNKKTQLEKELAKLKKKDESVEEALTATEKEMQEITKNIEGLKGKIQEEIKRQKEMDKEVNKLEKERDTINKNYTAMQSSISSVNAAINLHTARIKELDEKKVALKKEYDRLTNGQSVEKQIKELKDQEKDVQTKVQKLKDESKKANDEQKTAQSKKEALEIKRRSLEASLNDIEKRLSGLKVELKTVQTEFKNAERDKGSAEMNKSTLDKEMKELQKNKEKNDKQVEGINTKINSLTENRKKLQTDIDKREQEYSQSSGELERILQTLTEIMQNIDKSSADIKTAMQNASVEAIDKSISSFKNFMMDINDMLGAIEELGEMKPDDVVKKIKETIDPVVVNVKLLSENIGTTVEQLASQVKEANDVAVQDSSKNFDDFIQEFLNKFDNIRVALKALSLSSSNEPYKQLESLGQDIQTQTQQLASIKNDLTKINTQLEQKQKEMKQIDTLITELNAKMAENQSKIEKSEKENEDKTKSGAQIVEDIKKISHEMDEMKKFGDDFWKNTKDLQTNIDKLGEDLTQIQKDLGDLKGVQRLLDDIDTATQEQKKLGVEIENKKKEIVDQAKQSDHIQEQITNVNERIKTVQTDRTKADETRADLQKQIDDQNEKLKATTDKMRNLQNVKKLISDIESLTKENEEATEKIASNTKEIQVQEKKIGEFQTQIGTKDKEIEGLQKERAELEKTEGIQRKQLQEFTDNKNASEKELAKQQQMKDRAVEIAGLIKEIGDMKDKIAEFNELIKSMTQEIGKQEQNRIQKVDQINDLQKQKSNSWEKQKLMRDELGSLTAELSKQQAKLSNLESRKIVCEEKIDQLFESSKEFGTLPPVTDDLAEPTLNEKIAKASNEKKSLEPVNLKAIEEYETIKERFDEIDMRRQTLQRERKAIMDSIDRIELEKTRTFMKAYHEINRVFSEVFQQLSPGGSAKMMLENPAKPFEGGIEIEARPRGKKISSLQILSGGEKTLVALSFIFAVQNFYPAPFYVMDEIDAALDGPNVYRVSQVIKEYASTSQFLVISHREENITNAEKIYGVAMQDGITDIFTVNLEEERHREDFGAAVEGSKEGQKPVDKEDDRMISDVKKEHADEKDEIEDETEK